MKSKTPKPLKKLSGKPLVFWTLDLLDEAGIGDIVVVTQKSGDRVEREIKSAGYRVSFKEQKKPLGTADAVKKGLEKIPKACKVVLILYSDDSAFYTKETIDRLIGRKQSSESPGALLVLRGEKPTELGGLKMDDKSRPVGVLSKRQLEEEAYGEHEILCGAFCFDRGWLARNIEEVQKSRVSGEYPLPGLIKIAAEMEEYFVLVPLENEKEWRSINSQEQLRKAQKLKGRHES